MASILRALLEERFVDHGTRRCFTITWQGCIDMASCGSSSSPFDHGLPRKVVASSRNPRWIWARQMPLCKRWARSAAILKTRLQSPPGRSSIQPHSKVPRLANQFKATLAGIGTTAQLPTSEVARQMGRNLTDQGVTR